MLVKLNYSPLIKTALVSSLFFSISLFSWQAPLSGGIHVAGGFSKFVSKEVESIENQSAWTLGAELNWRVNEWFSFEPGLQYSKEGPFGFVSVPFVSKISIPLGEVEPYFFIGPYFALATSRSGDEMKAIDFGSLQGLGCFIPINYQWALKFDVRFKVGSVDLDSRENVSLRSRSLQLNLGAVFPI